MERNLKIRTKRFAMDIINLVEQLPNTISARAIGNQLIRSGTSVAANYRSATRGRSNREFAAKIGVVFKDADEIDLWLELIQEKGWLEVSNVKKETNELISIFVTIVKKMKTNS